MQILSYAIYEYQYIQHTKFISMRSSYNKKDKQKEEKGSGNMFKQLYFLIFVILIFN